MVMVFGFGVPKHAPSCPVEEILRGGLSLAGKEAKKKDETKEEEIQPVVVGEIKSVDEGAKEAIG